MFVVTDAEGASYEFTYDPSDTPKGLDDVAEGDSVTVTYTGTVSEVDSFDGTIVSVSIGGICGVHPITEAIRKADYLMYLDKAEQKS